jgi:hypothetical protein
VISLPFYFGWTGMDRVAFIACGAFIILYSLLTDYELGLVRFLRIRFHLLLDALVGIAILASPALLNLPADQRVPLYAIGILALLLVFITKVRAEGTQSEATA